MLTVPRELGLPVLSYPITNKTKSNRDSLASISRALRQLHRVTSSFDWLIELSALDRYDWLEYRLLSWFGFTKLD